MFNVFHNGFRKTVDDRRTIGDGVPPGNRIDFHILVCDEIDLHKTRAGVWRLVRLISRMGLINPKSKVQFRFGDWEPLKP